ncbi:MAG: indolepyruvate oxidoreductase subunit IorB [Rhizobiales bacterium]|nr:indolepyruvate oxidoreductase subunit IorB [Hyphomicrobiales bacterium]
MRLSLPTKLPVPLRLLKERYFGEASRNPWVARNKLAGLIARLPPEVAAIVSDAVPALMAYQDADHALLYLDRIGRYAGGRLDPVIFADLARRMRARMLYEDPPAIAHDLLIRAGGEAARPDPSLGATVRTFRWAELAAILPAETATSLIRMLDRLRWSDKIKELRFSAATPGDLRWLRFWSAVRQARPYSLRFAQERMWVERWLHMIDRGMAKDPAAAAAIVETADLVEGYGMPCKVGLMKWNCIVDTLIKPICDGAVAIPNLGAAVRRAHRVARDNPSLDDLRGEIALIIADGATVAPAAALH